MLRDSYVLWLFWKFDRMLLFGHVLALLPFPF